MTTSIDIIKPLYEWTSVRWNKCLALYEFAKQATGPIVELGCYDGNGTLALAIGSRDGNGVPVYGIDQFKRFTGLYQQQFYPEDEARLKEYLSVVGVADIVTVIKATSEEASTAWDKGDINLLVWDISLPRLYQDWLLWEPYIKGLFLAKDTSVFDFGWREVYGHAMANGWQKGPILPDACLYGVRND